MANITVNKQQLERPEFREEIISVLNTSPSAIFEIANREDLDGFVKVFDPGQKGFLGRKISCKHAKSNMSMNYLAKEIYLFTSDKYPLEISFKSAEDLEDFAVGYTKAAQTIPVPADTPVVDSPKTPSVQGRPSGSTQSKPDLDDPSVNRRAESFLNTVLVVLKVFTWITAIGLVTTAIINIVTDGITGLAFGFFFGAGLIVLYYYLIWAVFKVFLNMSNNLFGIREDLRSLKNK